MKHYLLPAIAFAIGACQSDQPGPTAPTPRYDLITAAAEPEGPPGSYPFGPDTYRIGRFTGGGPKLRCSTSSSGERTCDGFLRSFDKTALDVRLEIPAGSGPRPLVALIHGY